MTEEKTGMSTGKKLVIAFIIVLLLLTGAGYYAGVRFFSEHFLPGTYVNGFNCSFKTVSETEDLIDKKIGAYVLAIQTRGNGQESFSAEQAGLYYQDNDSVEKLMEGQDRYKWFLALGTKTRHAVPSIIGYDDILLNRNMSLLDCMQKERNVAPVDAVIQEAEDGTFVIIPGSEGSMLDQSKVKKLLVDAVTTGGTVLDLEEKDAYIDAAMQAAFYVGIILGIGAVQ